MDQVGQLNSKHYFFTYHRLVILKAAVKKYEGESCTNILTSNHKKLKVFSTTTTIRRNREDARKMRKKMHCGKNSWYPVLNYWWDILTQRWDIESIQGVRKMSWQLKLNTIVHLILHVLVNKGKDEYEKSIVRKLLYRLKQERWIIIENRCDIRIL